MPRFTETVNIQPQTVATGRPQLLMSLADKLDDFAGQAAAVAGQKIIERSSQEGASEGLRQQQSGEKLELKEPGLIGGVSRKAFNQAARETYLKSLDTDNIENISTLAAEHSSDLIGFNDAIEAYSKGVMDSIDPASKAAVGLSIDSMVSRFRPKIHAAQTKQIIDEANTAQSANATERSRVAQSASFDGDAEQAGVSLLAAMDSINNRTDIDDEQKAIEIRDVQLKERESHFAGELSREFDNEGSESALDKLDELSGKRPKGFTPDEWDDFISGEQTKINRKVARQAQVAKAISDETKKQLSIKRGGLFMNPEVPADPAKGSQDRKDVDAYYNDVSPEWSGLPIQEQVNLNVDFTKKTGIIPKTMVSNVNAAMRSGSAEQVQLMADYISRVQEESPASLKDIPEESRAISMMVADGARAGIDPQESLDQARKFTFGLTAAEKQTISIQTQVMSKELATNLQNLVDSDVIDGGFDTGIFSRVPDVSAAMSGEYRNTVDRFMKMTGGNTDQSQRLAYEAIKSTWGVTETGGEKRFMKYAPEAVYNVPGYGSNWIEDQFNEEMETIGAVGAVIATDHTTAREDKPSYPVLVANPKTGVLEPLLVGFNSALTGELGSIPNPEGGVSTEKSLTVTDDRLNEGRPTNIPQLVQGQSDEAVQRILRDQGTAADIEVSVKRAIERSKKGQNLPSFDSIESAVAAAVQRSKEGGSLKVGEVMRWRPDFKSTDEYKAIIGAPGEKLQSAKQQRRVGLEKRAGKVRRAVQSRTLKGILNLQEREEFMNTADGKAKTSRSISNLLSEGRISEQEATQARSAFGVE